MQRYGERSEKFWVTGFTATDVLWENLQAPPPQGAGRTILYAPTWQPELSAHSVVGTHWSREWLEQGNHRIIVKLHPHTGKVQKQNILDWFNLKQAFPNQVVVPHPDTNIYDLMARSDILVTDTSSVMFYWLAVDNPVILVDPAQASGRFFDPDGPEWQWRDMGHRVSDSEGLVRAIRTCVDRPDEHKGRRDNYRSRVYGDLFDGKASERLVTKLVELVQAG